MSRSLISVPKTAKKGDIVEIRAMTAHPMETGHRMGPNGVPIARNILTRLTCTYKGEEVFAADFFPAISANPFVSFSLIATESGTISFEWTGDGGQSETASAEIVVS